MTPEVTVTAACPDCAESVPLADLEAHRRACPGAMRERVKEWVRRPKAWSYVPGLVREVLADDGKTLYVIAVTENPLTRAQLGALRNLLTLVWEETTPPPVPVASDIPAA